MDGIKVYIKVDPSKELPLISEAKEEYSKSIDFEDFDDLFLSGTMTEGDINKIAKLYGEKIIENNFKPISLTELMVGFAEWKDRTFYKIDQNCYIYLYDNISTDNRFTYEMLVDQYLNSKGIVL